MRAPHRADRAALTGLVCLCVLLAVNACSKVDPWRSSGEHVGSTASQVASSPSPEPNEPSEKSPSTASTPVRFDDCALFRTNERYTQWRCRPRGLFIFNLDTSRETEGSRSLAQLTTRALSTVYRDEEWEMIKKAPPKRQGSSSPSAADSYAHIEIRSRTIGTLVTAVGASLPDGALAVCVLPATLPNAVGLCEKSVEALLAGRKPPPIDRERP